MVNDSIEEPVEDDMSTMRQRNTLLEENIKLKKDQKQTNEKFDKLLSVIGSKMDRMTAALNNLNRESIINKVVVQDFDKTKSDKKVVKKEVDRIFIPTPVTKDMKISVSDPKKKIRKTKIGDSVSKLSELQKK